MDTEGKDTGQHYSPNQVILMSMRLFFAIIVNELKDHVNRAYEEGGSEDLDTEKVKRYIFLH